MMGLKFYKMQGLGNDFILIDNMSLSLRLEASNLARRWCRRGLSIGADGLVILEPDDEVDFRWRFHNRDGSEAEMCGNASRCVAWLAHELGLAGKSLAFRTLAGVVRAEVNGSSVKVEMPRPHGFRPGLSLNVDGQDVDLGFIDVGVPHVVSFPPDLKTVDVAGLGPKIRHHPDLSPAGANVNFAAVLEPQALEIRTYERGVEAETLACGTGAVSSALISHLRGLVRPPTRVRVASDEELIIHFEPNPGQSDPWPSPVFMEGEATLVFTGEAGEEA